MAAEQFDYGIFYRTWHSDEAEHVKHMSSYHQAQLAPYLSSVPRDGKVLDVGCGMGFALLAAQALGFKDVQGVDIDEGQVASCVAKGLRVQRLDDSTSFLQAHQATFSVITALDVIEHIDRSKQIAFVRAIHDALVPGGVFVCTVPNANALFSMRWLYMDYTHQCSFTEYSLNYLLRGVGFPSTQIAGSEISIAFDQGAVALKRAVTLLMRRVVRGFHRVQLMVEFGVDHGRRAPVGLNLIACAKRAT